MPGRKPDLFGVLFILLGAAYFLVISRPPAVPGAVLKILPILMLVGRAASRAPGNRRIYLSVGLLCSLAGDAILALHPETFFVQGVAAFFAAHVLYIVTFGRDIGYSTRSAVLAGVVVMWCTAVGLTVFPHLGNLKAPVVAYMVVIAAMGASAAFATGARLTLFAGAFAFIVSDSMLALDRFVVHLPYAPYAVMATYYFGQFYIVEGVVGVGGRHTSRPESEAFA